MSKPLLEKILNRVKREGLEIDQSSFGKFELKMPDYNMNIDIGYHSEMIIIGNIFENPELLKNEN